MGGGDLSAGDARGAYVCALILGKEINEVECSGRSGWGRWRETPQLNESGTWGECAAVLVRLEYCKRTARARSCGRLA